MTELMNDNRKKKTILLTGATGFLGETVARRLKQQGHRLICLVRGANGAERLRSKIPLLASDDAVLVCDLSRERAEWDPALVDCRGSIDAVAHCASMVRFHEYLAQDIHRTNVEGTRQLLGLATELQVPEFHYVSTAYVAGDAETFEESDREKGQKTRNPYEASKLEAEKQVAAWREGRYSIYRPSVIVGDQETGLSQSDTGFYGIHAVFERLKRLLLRILSVDGVEYREAGIFFDSKQVLNLPLSVRTSASSTLNLIPVDWVGNMMGELLGQPASNAVYHLVHPDPPMARWVFQTSVELFGIRGMHFDGRSAGPSEILDRMQRLMDRNIGIYDPYINRTEARFGDAAVRAALGDRYTPPPEVDRKFLAHLLKHAVYQEGTA